MKRVGGLSGVAIERLHVKDHTKALEQRRFPYPDFFRVLVRKQYQKSDDLDFSNQRAWHKLGFLDKPGGYAAKALV